uniref:MICOS complex subunit n=1 Tax=Timema shepardi TaxID=629360 RepID=A0A7R9B2B2_TIMSH|nr:unnamed protein product [Timema shepardi]
MFKLKVLRKFLLPGGMCAATVITASPSDKLPASTDTKKEHCECESKPHTHGKRLIRPSELPLYPEDILYESVREEKILDESSALEETIRKVRKEIWSYYDVYKGYRQRVTDFFETGIAHTESTRHFLQEEENFLPRVGAITLGVLTGFVLGLRGGRFKRLTYSTLGGLTMASICYPREANEVTQEAIFQAKKYFTIGYNFAYGVTPEDLKPVLPTPPSGSTQPTSTAVPDHLVKVPPHLGQPEPDCSCGRSLDQIGDTLSDIQYWGFPLRDNSAWSAKPQNHGPGADQSIAADKDLYTTRS